MNTELRIDTERLHAHTDLLREEYRYAQMLREHLKNARILAPELVQEQISVMIQKATYIARHSALMQERLEEISYDSERLIKKIGDTLENWVAMNAVETE